VRIDVISPMLSALRLGTAEYQPDFPDLTLAREQRDAGVSISNLRLLFADGLTLASLVAGPAGLLFIFDTGEEYLATGLRVGRQSAAVLAELMASLGHGEEAELSEFYAALPDDYDGPVPLDRADMAG
jgi:hypothetical protein